MSNILMNPTAVTLSRQSIESRELIEGEDVKVMRTKMKSFYEMYKTEYNES